MARIDEVGGRERGPSEEIVELARRLSIVCPHLDGKTDFTASEKFDGAHVVWVPEQQFYTVDWDHDGVKENLVVIPNRMDTKNISAGFCSYVRHEELGTKFRDFDRIIRPYCEVDENFQPIPGREAIVSGGERDHVDPDDHFAEAPTEHASANPKAHLLSRWARATGKPDPNVVKKQKGKTRGRLGKALLGLGAAAALGGGAYYGKNALWPVDGSAAPTAGRSAQTPAKNSQNSDAPEQKEFPESISGTVEVSYSKSEKCIVLANFHGTTKPELAALKTHVNVGFARDLGGGEISAPVELIFTNGDGNTVVTYTFDAYSHRTKGASMKVNFTATKK